MINLDECLNNVDNLYNEINEISNKLVQKDIDNINLIVNKLNTAVESLSNDEIRNIVLEFYVMSNTLIESKERLEMQYRSAKLLKNEAYSNSYVLAEGSIENKKNITNLKIKNEQLTELVFEMAFNKLEERHKYCMKLASSMNDLLVTRLSEAKLDAKTLS